MTAESLLSILLRGAALSVVTLAGVVALRRASAAHRHLAWAAAAIALLLLPLAAWTLPRLDVALLPAPAARTPAPARVAAPIAAAPIRATATDTGASFVPDETQPNAPPPAAPAVASSRKAAPSPLVLAWLAGAVFVALRLALGAVAARRLVARSEPVADARVLDIARDAARRLGLRAPPSLRITRDVDAPVTIGALGPHVLLPADALSWRADELRLALQHECAHVRRRDLLAELAARLAVVVHWPNPLAWFAVSRLRIERERASDDLVLAAGNRADEYATFLVSLARALRRTSPPAAVAATMAGGPQFERRVRALLDDGQRRLAPSPRPRVLFAILAASSLSFAACVRPTRATSGGEEHEIAAAPSADPANAFESPPEQRIFKSIGAAVAVELDGSGQYTSISAALAAAPEGALVRVGPGTFDEHVVVTKAVTIEGAGADRTTIVSTVYEARERAEVQAAFERRMSAATTDDERAAAKADLRKRWSDTLHPTLQVEDVRGVVVRGLALSGRGDRPEGGSAPGSVVDVVKGGVRIERCAIVGGPGAGVIVGFGSDVVIEGCLVAAVWDTGVLVSGTDAKARIADCDIRNCWQKGVQIAPGNRDVTIERCRISGSSWHGIRYDSAVPTIRGNLIFENVRSGIYASGDTAGRIEGNLFFRNGMSDVSCWFEAKDTIEGNSFVESQREAVAILGASNPVVRRNVFFACRTALMGSGIADGKGTQSTYGGGGVVEANVFWKNGTDFQRPGTDGKASASPLPAGNDVADPHFVDVAQRDYSLRSGSAAGAASPPALASPWPLRPEETATAPKETPQPPAAPAAPAPAAAKSVAGGAVDLARAKADVLQINDPAQRERGLAAIGAAIASADPNVARPALASLYELRDVKYDKRRFRVDVVRQLGNADAGVQTAAAYALMQVEREPGDVDLVLAAAEGKPVAPGGLLYVAMILSKNRVEGRLADAFVKALAVDDPRRGAMDTANYLRGMWVAPAVEDAVVAAWRRYVSAGHERLLWPYILGQMQPAPRESRVRAIFEMMAGGDDGVRQLAGGMVTKPVDESARPLGAELAAAGLATAPTSSLRRTYLDAIRANGGRGEVAGLRALAANEMVGDDLRSLAGTIADELERR